MTARKRRRNSMPQGDLNKQDPGMPWGKFILLAVLLVVIGFAVNLLLNLDRRPTQRTETESVATAEAENGQAKETEDSANDGTDAPAMSADLTKLKGRWQRTDAAYQIAIKEVHPDGSLDAAYSNPSPIHVTKATAKIDEGVATVFLELRDVGYPGCTYHLTYDPEQDTLRGVYYQAAQGQEYTIEFTRL